MDNFYNLSKYISLKHIQKFRICHHWANEIYHAHKGIYDSINDPDQRKKYLWLYLKKSLLKANYKEYYNCMYYIDYKTRTTIIVIKQIVIHRSYPFYLTATDREIDNNYFIKSITDYDCNNHLIYINTDNMYKVFNAINDLSSNDFKNNLKYHKSLIEYKELRDFINECLHYPDTDKSDLTHANSCLNVILTDFDIINEVFFQYAKRFR